MLTLQFYDESEKQSPLFQALNRVILPHRHIHRTWEYPKTLVEIFTGQIPRSILCVGGMWDSLGLYLSSQTERFICIDLVSINELVCWYGDPVPENAELLAGPAEILLPQFFRDQEIDVVFSVSTIEHCDPEVRSTIFREMCRIARYRVVVTIDFALEPARGDQLSEEDIKNLLSPDERISRVRGIAPPVGDWAPACLTWSRE